MSLDGIRIGFCMTGSFCTFEKAFAAAERLVQQGAKLVPIMFMLPCGDNGCGRWDNA